MIIGIRDYIHVMDLANGHVAALKLLNDNQVGLKVCINCRFVKKNVFSKCQVTKHYEFWKKELLSLSTPH